MSPILITALLFGLMLLLLFSGMRLGLALLTTATCWVLLFDSPQAMNILIYNTFSAMQNFILLALPLFIFMGLILERSGVTERLFDVMSVLLERVPGGLGIGCIIICVIIAAMAGVSGAATVSLGTIAVGPMLKHGYDKHLTVGTIMAGGALGFLIPPSVLLLLYAFIAQLSVGRLFAAGFLPGLLLAVIYCIYFSFKSRGLGKKDGNEKRVTSFREKLWLSRALIGPLLLVAAVLGTIATGVATPVEASAVGVVGSLLLAHNNGGLSWPNLQYALVGTLHLMGIVFYITIGALFFSKLYTSLSAAPVIIEWILNRDVPPFAIVAAMIAILLVLGMFLDDFAILFITVPLFAPAIVTLGYDPIWFAIVFIMCMETAYLSPPFGFNLFYMRSVVPPSITMMDLYKGALPFIALQILGLLIILAVPGIVTLLPDLIYGK